MERHRDPSLFEDRRPALLGLAYRILGSKADAEDAVQDTFLKWDAADQGKIENPASWLTTVCTRRCIDLLRAAHRTRVDYVGAWLPEPIHTSTEDMSDDSPALAASLSTAFLLLLERLTPKERAAYLLYEIFELSYAEIATTLGVQETACRKLVSRARANVDKTSIRHLTPAKRQEELLAAFQSAVTTGRTDELKALMSSDIELHADGGGRVPTIEEVLHGKADVLAFVSQDLRKHWAGYQWIVSGLNGSLGIILRKEGRTVGSISFGYDETGNATRIYVVRNPDKLIGLSGFAAS